MAGSTPLHPLEQEDPATVQTEWRVQRVGWVVLAGIVVAALAGVFGAGPLSWTSASADDASLVVKYSRFAREGGAISLEVHVPAERSTEGRSGSGPTTTSWEAWRCNRSRPSRRRSHRSTAA